MPTQSRRLPTFFIPHGGGPCFFMDPFPGFPPNLWEPMGQYLKSIASSLDRKPKAVVVISGHWDSEPLIVNTAQQHTLLYDYYGFPPYTYQLKYPAEGSPALAHRVRDILQQAGFPVSEDSARGLDHGVFIPFMLVFPEADVPIVQLSLHASFDASLHLAIGEALAPLRDEDILIVGSGMSYHNLRQMFRPTPEGNELSVAFDAWLTSAVTQPDPEQTKRLLGQWSDAPGAREAHPMPEHLIPLMVAAGAADGDAGVRDFHDVLIGKAISGYRFG